MFAAFGGFLAGIAPPQAADARFAVGISSFFTLIILLIITSFSGNQYRRAWTIAAICLLVISASAAYYYKATYDDLTFEFPPGNTKVEYIAGTELTPLAQQAKRMHQGISNAQLLDGFGGILNKGKVWTEVSVNSARRKLIASYIILVIAISASIFSLTEGTLGGRTLGKNRIVTKGRSPKPKTTT